MNLPELCIRRPVMTTLVMGAFIIFGIFAYRLLPVAALPRVDFPTINVSATLPGANPETMAASVATPLERQFSTIAGITTMSSSSSLGSTQITLQFDLDRNIDAAAQDVQSAISVAQRRLPIEMTDPPSYRKVNPADAPILFLSLTSSVLPLSTVDDYAETQVAERISTVPGVAQVQVYGQQKYAVRVQVDPDALAARGIGIDDVRQALADTNSNAPLGTLMGERRLLTLQATGQLKKAADYGPLIVTYRNGAPVRLGEIAHIIDGVENNRTAGWYNGTRSITLAIQRQPDANTVEVVDGIKALLPTLRAQIPAAIELHVVNDRSQSIRASVREVQFTLGLTVALVVLVIFLFLRRLSATIIPALALPVSLIGTCAGMYLFGYSIDNLSLLALTLSVGFVVDDAIVMLENCVRHVERGERPMQAALTGGREIGFTIISMTLSLVAVFIPVLFMGGVVGRVFREFAVTITMAILISGFVSLTLTPMLCSRFLRSEAGAHGWFYRTLEAAFTAMLSAYRWALDWVLAHRRLTLGVTLITLAVTGYLYAAVPKGFFPTEDTGLLTATTEAAEDISFDAMVVLQKQIAEIVRQDPDVDVVTSSVGGGFNGTLNQGRLFIGLKDFGKRDSSADQVMQRLRKAVAGVADMRVYFQVVQNINIGGRLSKSQYQYTLQGTDLAELTHWTPLVEEKVKQLPGFQDVTSDLETKNPQAYVAIDREKAATLGITPDQIRSSLYSAFGARQVSTIYMPTDDYAVILEVDPARQRDKTDLSRLYISSPGGKLVPIGTFATITETIGPLTVNHQWQLPAATISFNLAPGVALGDAVKRIEAAQRDLALPATIIPSFQGTAQVFQDSLRGQGLLLAAAVLVIYIVLGILYESFIHPITILSGLPSAGLGALLMLLAVGQDLTVIAIIGIVLLIGIVKKNAIMMIDFALTRRRDGQTDAVAAIREACLLRFRPIMMTTMAAIMGGLPIALGLGAGSELRRPLGLTVVGGLIASQLLTLYITPVVFMYLDAAGRRLGRLRWRRAAPAPTEEPAGDELVVLRPRRAKVAGKDVEAAE
ncbi:MAG TPA: multidrug efflux RND transporter permease subunit [Methylomirabilota bacterium]|nr:multidrug efflux RND transporter permease subunit [Methylomirabilota bacterium]